MRDIECRECGKIFESRNGKKYCSDACRTTATKRQWTEANVRRKEGTTCQLSTKICPICSNHFEGDYKQIYCSAECREKGMKKRQKEYFSEWYQENNEHVIKKVLDAKKDRK